MATKLRPNRQKSHKMAITSVVCDISMHSWRAYVHFRNKALYLAWWFAWTFSSILSLATNQFLHFLKFAKMLIMYTIVMLLSQY